MPRQERMVQSHVPTQYQQEQVEFQKQQVDIQKQMRDLLHQQVREKPWGHAAKQCSEEEEEEPVEEEKMATKKTVAHEDAFEPEQADIQHQMKELLKKQRTARVNEPEEEDEEEEAEEDKEEGKEVA